MSHLSETKNGISITWVDGYLLPREDLAKAVKRYQNINPEFNAEQLDFLPKEKWPRERIFKYAASMMTSDFHKAMQLYKSPCSVWLAELDGYEPITKNISAETEADCRKDDYHHIIGVHDSNNAEACIYHLINGIDFEIKKDEDYNNCELFYKTREQIARELLQVFAFPYNMADGILNASGFKTSRYVR